MTRGSRLMGFASEYAAQEPTRAEVDAVAGQLLLEFGAPWCGYCREAQPLLASALEHAALRHIKIEDGKGRRLGRSFAVKLWPTLIFLHDGREIVRLVRPGNSTEIREALQALQTQAS